MKVRNSYNNLSSLWHRAGRGFPPLRQPSCSGGLCGTVCNKGSYVEILVQGETSARMRFQKDLKALAPEWSVILKMDVAEQKRSLFPIFRLSRAKKVR